MGGAARTVDDDEHPNCAAALGGRGVVWPTANLVQEFKNNWYGKDPQLMITLGRTQINMGFTTIIRNLKNGGMSTKNKSMYSAMCPLIVVLRLFALFFVMEKSGSTTYYKLSFLNIHSSVGFTTFSLVVYSVFSNCSIYSITCNIPLLLNIAFLPISIFTERKLCALFNTVADIDRDLRSSHTPRVADRRRTSVNIVFIMILHLLLINFLISYGESFSTTTVGVRFGLLYMAMQRRFTFVMFKFFCDEMGERFQLVESAWLAAWRVHDTYKMEATRLLHERLHGAVSLLSSAFGSRLLFVMLDSFFQCSRFLVFTFMLNAEKNVYFFIFFVLYHLYCLHSTTTAAENMIIKAELLWMQIEASPLEVSVCGFFSYNRALLLTSVSGLVTVWALTIQTAPAFTQVLLYIHKHDIHH
ncbi:hypothetical protein J6590_070869 [Homalodisca vitripennis]|nr:hypothetical protein J6590_070869 [Homalodisca vitripennis]